MHRQKISNQLSFMKLNFFNRIYSSCAIKEFLTHVKVSSGRWEDEDVESVNEFRKDSDRVLESGLVPDVVAG